MYPFVKPSKTKYTHGHQGKAEYRVHYYRSSFSRAIDQPPPDFLFKTRLVGDTYTNKVEGGEMQIWVRDIECDWTPAAEEHEHPYLTPPGKSDPYVLHVRDDEYAAWIKPESLKMMKARKAREAMRASEQLIEGCNMGASDYGASGGHTTEPQVTTSSN